jgi:hypothetical protein
MTATCTATTGARGERCGAEAIQTFTGSGGETFAECREHAVTIWLFCGAWTIRGGTLRKERLAGTRTYRWTYTTRGGRTTQAATRAAALAGGS